MLSIVWCTLLARKRLLKSFFKEQIFFSGALNELTHLYVLSEYIFDCSSYAFFGFEQKQLFFYKVKTETLIEWSADLRFFHIRRVRSVLRRCDYTPDLCGAMCACSISKVVAFVLFSLDLISGFHLTLFYLMCVHAKKYFNVSGKKAQLCALVLV